MNKLGKIFLALTISFISSNIFSEETTNYLLYCQGNSGKIAVEFYIANDKAILSYYNAEGRNSFPVFEGVVTQNAVPIINAAFSELAPIDNRLVLQWDAKNCQIKNPHEKIFQCNGRGEVIYPENSNLESFILNSTMATEEGFNFSHEVFRIRLGLDSPNLHYSIVMPLNPEHCGVSSTRK